MRAELHETALNLTIFAKHSQKPRNEVDMFVHKVVRLISLLHAFALECVTEIAHKDLPIIDLDAIPDEQLEYLHSLPSRLRVEVIHQWVTSLLVESMYSGMMTVPPPIYTRVFQQLERSKMEFSQVLQLINIPFPFPYAQAAKMLLAIYSVFTPVVMVFWSSSVQSSFMFTFFSTFGMFCIEIIATEIEHPFGEDANDLPVVEFQEEINSGLLLLMEPLAQRAPELSEKAKLNHKQLISMKRHSSFYDVVEQISSTKSDEILMSMQKEEDKILSEENQLSMAEQSNQDTVVLNVAAIKQDGPVTNYEAVLCSTGRECVPDARRIHVRSNITCPEQLLEQQVCVNRDLLTALQQIVDRLPPNQLTSDRPNIPASRIDHAPSLLLTRSKVVHQSFAGMKHSQMA